MNKFILIDNHESFLNEKNGSTYTPLLTWKYDSTWEYNNDNYFYMIKQHNSFIFFSGYLQSNTQKHCGVLASFIDKEILIDAGEYLFNLMNKDELHG